MAHAPERTRNGSLADGMTDGTYKKRVRDRGGFVETTALEAREMLNLDTFGPPETGNKQMPDGTDRYATGDIQYRSPIRNH